MFFKNVGSKTIVQAMILLIVFLMALPYIPIFDKREMLGLFLFLFFGSIFLFLFLFASFLNVPISKFKRKRDWVEWLNIFCILGIIYMPLFGIINSIEKYEIPLYAITLYFAFYCGLDFTFVCGLPLPLTFILYFFRNLKVYLLVAFISVFLFFIGTMPLFGPIDEEDADTWKVTIEDYLSVISHFFRIILTMAVIIRNLDSIERIE